MIRLLKKIVVAFLTVDAKRLLKRHNPEIIAITGNVGKTSTKDAIYQIVEPTARVCEGSFNSDIGVPLSILNLPNQWRNPIGWLKNLFEAKYISYFLEKYEDTLILEVGADSPGDIKNIAKWLKPDVLCITTIPEVPVHIEAFGTREKVLEEKGSLIDSVKPKGTIILNADDGNYEYFLNKAKCKGRKGGKILKVGISEGLILNIKNIKSTITTNYAYTTAKLCYIDECYNIKIKNTVGIQVVYPILYASALALSRGISMQEVVKRINNYNSPAGRARFLKGIKKSKIIDDTYNSSPSAVYKMLSLMRKRSERKIVILGDMRELGEYSILEHKNIGKKVAEFADVFISVGNEMKYASDEAIEKDMKNVLHFENSIEASNVVKQIIKEDDIILVKGSQATRMEKIVEKIVEKTYDKKYLIRQSKEWKKKIIDINHI